MGSAGLARVGVVASVGVAALAIFAIVFSASSPRVEPQSTTFVGARVLPPGLAPVGLPMIPVRLAPDGTLLGLPDHLDWYGYCSPAGTPGLSRDYRGPNTFQVQSAPEKIAKAEIQGLTLWWKPLLNSTLRGDDFPSTGLAVPAIWRSPGTDPTRDLHVLVFKLDTAPYSPAVRNEFAPDGFVAFMAPSTGYCCVAGYQENTIPLARVHGQDIIYDSCHDSRWDPLDVRTYKVPEDWRLGFGRFAKITPNA